ncbi:hypothetical protein [Foetidibacter luteolus]|uniref:hypothetical protein n=1 Tax=Foetidibacter luteolus TaxID=2608880 RepID=UPI00129BE68A|nr:hypothetical protein [Foetidibacter luteolus]
MIFIIQLILVVLPGMAIGNTLKVVFKEIHQNQLMALPPTLDELIARNHPVRPALISIHSLIVKCK